jgi:hypothetical protein
MMRELRSPNQILFSHLPEQTVDLRGRVWKVDRWKNPLPLPVDQEAVRRRLLGAVEIWRANGQDNDFAAALHQQRAIEVVGVNPDEGVKVDAFPDLWRCQNCRRVQRKPGRCVCGVDSWAQLHFVAFHECGWSDAPTVPRCPQHNQTRVDHSDSSSVRDLRFSCPVCDRQLSSGLGGGRPCPGCGQPAVIVNVHRAASVYTPQPFTMVNPARPKNLQDLMLRGGMDGCLRWVLADMPTPRPESAGATQQSIFEALLVAGVDKAFAQQQAAAMAASGGLPAAAAPLPLTETVREDAEGSALEVALALYEGRRSASALATAPAGEDLLRIYRDQYPPALRTAGLSEVDHVERFPILRGVFGYTRGGKPAGETRLVGFSGRSHSIRVHADANETEALYIRLDPVRVAAWLQDRGLISDAPQDAADARLAVLQAMTVPSRADDDQEQNVGTAVLTLLHSYAHRFIRQLAVLAGVDRESLAEYLVPEHLSLFVYATPRGDFVLGGLQAVFETELDRVLDLQVGAETRCPLDPGCDRSSGACLACLHIGEPSCSHYNRFLDRKSLFGAQGYLRQDLTASTAGGPPD